MICKICNKNIATQKHHCFPQTKINRKIYGKLLDEPFNLVDVCHDCHVSHRNILKEYMWNEKQFRIAIVLNELNLPLATKSYDQKWGNDDLP